jgi:transcriptional regulator GlxA family with amidase domain
MAPLQVGALVFQYQAIDVVGPLDLLNGSSKFIQTAVGTYTPIDEKVIAAAPDFTFHHIGENLEPVALMSSAIVVKPTVTVDDCPPLDLLLVGGADPGSYELPTRLANFIQRHVESGKLLFTTCTGSAMVASTGVLNGRNATINNQEFNWVKKQYPEVRWSKETKWVIDGNIWTSSGALAGMDMFAFWLQENYGPDVMRAGAAVLDFEPRDHKGVQNVLSKRYDAAGKQISTHIYV